MTRGAWVLDAKQSFVEAVRTIIPSMYDQFLSRADTVIHHPRLTGELHRMRIDGKPLRYLMELFEDRFKAPFGECLKEIKNLIELMGAIHDCDVMIPMMQSHLQEVRFFNKSAGKRGGKFSTAGILELIRRQRSERMKSFQQLCDTLRMWESENFRDRLVHSLQLNDDPVNQNHHIPLTTHGNLHLASRTGS